MVSASCTYKERKQLSEVQSSQYARVGLRIKALSRLEVVKLTKKDIIIKKDNNGRELGLMIKASSRLE